MNNFTAPTTATLDFSRLAPQFGKELAVDFTGGDLTTDSGLLLLALADHKCGLTRSLAAAMEDRRKAGKIRHGLETSVRARIGGIAADYVDCNDIANMGRNPGLLVFCGKVPQNGKGPEKSELASQPTLSRLENNVTSRELLKAGLALARCAIGQLPQDAPQIIVDLDGTDIECHGQQEFQGFNKYYDHNCYLPLLVHVSVPGGFKWLATSLLRPARSGNTCGVRFILSRLLPMLREQCPGAQILVRADAGFGTWKIVSFLEKQQVKYVLGWRVSQYLLGATDYVARAAQVKCERFRSCYLPDARLTTKQLLKRLDLRARRAQAPPEARRARKRRTECVSYGRELHPTTDQENARWILVKATATPALDEDEAKVHRHFLMTNLSPIESQALPGLRWSREIHPFYCLRGDQENRIKEWKLDLRAGRTSCHRFAANQFRLLLHTAALFLLNVIQHLMPPTKAFANPQVNTLRMHLLKVAARFRVTHRRIVVKLPSSFPYKDTWYQLTAALNALPEP